MRQRKDQRDPRSEKDLTPVTGFEDTKRWP